MRSTEILNCKILKIFLVFGLILVCGCKEEKTNGHLGDDPPKITIDEFSLTETDNGRKIYKLNAEYARVYDEVIKVDSINIIFYDKEEVETYPHAIFQIVNHLASNAVIHGFGDREEGEIDIEIVRDKDQMILYFFDNGRGMTSDTLINIFEPFFTTMEGKNGSGLGLYIVYNIVTQKLKGDIICKTKTRKE